VGGITEGHLVRHCQGSRTTRDATLLDIAQDHALFHLYRLGLFKQGLVFKGGTALRKYRAGTSGRFSTDLDFAAKDESLVINVFAALRGVAVDGFCFDVTDLGDDGRRAKLSVDTPFGTPNIMSKLELSRHETVLPPELLFALPMPIHKVYGFEVPSLPVVRLEEAVAEKLARFRRVALARDLYDLAWFALRPFDEPVARRLWILKTYMDVVEEKRGKGPIEPNQILREHFADEFVKEDIGYLVSNVDIPNWIATVQKRYAFLEALDDNERQWAMCNPRNRYSVVQALAGFK
jgi:predicted nucleotidyltransferase component of viral defense system